MQEINKYWQKPVESWKKVYGIPSMQEYK